MTNVYAIGCVGLMMAALQAWPSSGYSAEKTTHAAQPMQCKFCNIRYEDFSLRDMSGSNLVGAYMLGANVSWSVLTDSRLESSNLGLARLEWSDFDGTDLSKADLTEAAAFRATFRGTNLRMANLSRSNLSRGDFSNANLLTATGFEADFTDSRLGGAVLRQADFTNANFTGARLRDADLQGAIFNGADMRGVDLAGSNLSGASLREANFSYTRIARANFRKADLAKADLSNADIVAANFNGANLARANLSGALLSNVNLSDANLCMAIMPNGATGDCTAAQKRALDKEIAQEAMRAANSPIPQDAQAAPEVADSKPVPTVSANNNRIRVSAPGNVYSRIRDGVAIGIFPDAIKAALAESQSDSRFVTMSITDSISAMADGTVDIASSIVPTEAVKKVAWITAPLFHESNVVLTLREKSFKLSSTSDLLGKRIAVRTGYRYTMLESIPNLQLTRYRSDGEMIRALLFGREDAAVLSGISDIYAFRSEGIMSKLKVLDNAVGEVPFVVALSKKKFTEAQAQAFSEAIQRFKAGPGWDTTLEQAGMSDLFEPWPQLIPASQAMSQPAR